MCTSCGKLFFYPSKTCNNSSKTCNSSSKTCNSSSKTCNSFVITQYVRIEKYRFSKLLFYSIRIVRIVRSKEDQL